MYRPEELKDLEIKPKINDISLLVIKEFYYMFLMPFIYTYKVSDENGEKVFELRFDNNRLCHLLGIESIAKRLIRKTFSCMQNQRL